MPKKTTKVSVPKSATADSVLATPVSLCVRTPPIPPTAEPSIPIRSVKFHQSVKVGHKEVTYACSDNFTIELQGVIIKITDPDNNSTYSSIMNAPWWTL